MANLFEKLLKIMVKPESTTERLAHEAIEFIVYGEIYSRLKDFFDDE